MNITLRELLIRIINSNKCNFEQRVAFSAMYFTEPDRDIEVQKRYIAIGYSRAEESLFKQYNTLDELYGDFANIVEVMRLDNNLKEDGFWRFVILEDLQPVDIKYGDGRKYELIINWKNLINKIDSSKYTTFQHKLLYEYFQLMYLRRTTKDNKFYADKDFKFELIRYDTEGQLYIKVFDTVENAHTYVEQQYFDLKIKAENEGYYWEYILLSNGEAIDDLVNNSNLYTLNISKHNTLLWLDLLNYHEKLAKAREEGFKEGLKNVLKRYNNEN